MASGRYTGYRLYQNRTFQEAQDARVHPYKGGEYECAWSQRAYLFHFDDYQQRIQFDAANTSCCTDPVRPFENKPQYTDEGKPMTAVDCGAKVVAAGCNVMEIASQGAGPCSAPTGAAGAVTGIRIKCPTRCDELVDAQAGKRIRGVNGEFVYQGMAGPDIMEVSYFPDPEIGAEVWDDCRSKSYVETLCSELPITIAVFGGITKPNGCYCDCCRNLPAHGTESHGSCSGEYGGWGNTAYCGSVMKAQPNCSGEGEHWAVYWSSGHRMAGSEHVWESFPQLYVASSGTGTDMWGLSGIAGTFGDADYPACCGIRAQSVYYRGCGNPPNSGYVTMVVSSKRPWTAPSLYPAAGQLVEGESYSISGYPACAWANRAAVDFSGWTCLEDTSGSPDRALYRIARSTGTLTFTAGRCGDCCGFGEFTAHVNNGCDDTGSGHYLVRKPITYGASGSVIGRVLKCTATGNPGEYKVQEAELHCDGTNGVFTDGEFTYIPQESGIDYCNSVIGSGAGIIRYDDWPRKGCQSGAAPLNHCCYYSQNGESGSGFRAYIRQISGQTCCPDVPDVAGYYVRQWGNCCPAWGS